MKKLISIVTSFVLAVISMSSLITSAVIGDRDPNGDGNINLNDYVYIQQYLAGVLVPSDLDALDFDENGIVSYMDSYKILMHDAGLNVTIGNAASYGVNTVLNDSMSTSYYVYNAQNGNRIYSKNYTLSPPSISLNNTPDSTNSVIGYDSRVIDWTKSGVVKIMCTGGAGYLGTGFVVDSHTIATAAHCVVNNASSGKSISSIYLFNSNGTVSLQATPIETHVPVKYFDNSLFDNSLNDYALITVEEDLSSYLCFDLGVALDYSVPISLTATGFPQYVDTSSSCVNDATTHNMYSGTGTVQSISTLQIHYNADTSDGNSGCPIFVTESENGTVKHTVIAIHRGGNNFGTRINAEIIRFFYQNPNI